MLQPASQITLGSLEIPLREATQKPLNLDSVTQARAADVQTSHKIF